MNTESIAHEAEGGMRARGMHTCRVAYCFFDVVLDADQKDSRRQGTGMEQTP